MASDCRSRREQSATSRPNPLSVTKWGTAMARRPQPRTSTRVGSLPTRKTLQPQTWTPLRPHPMAPEPQSKPVARTATRRSASLDGSTRLDWRGWGGPGGWDSAGRGGCCQPRTLRRRATMLGNGPVLRRSHDPSLGAAVSRVHEVVKESVVSR
jgi:hypothetical protein